MDIRNVLLANLYALGMYKKFTLSELYQKQNDSFFEKL